MENGSSKGEPPRPSAGSRKGSRPNVRKGSVFEKPLDFDDVLVNEIGQFGCFQMTNILLVAFPIIMGAFVSEYIFSAGAIPHRCRISECGETSQSSPFEPTWVLDAIPTSGDSFDSCSRFVSSSNGTLTNCPANLFTSDTTDCSGEFVYERNNTVVYEFNLGCQDWYRALSGTLSSVGTLLVLPITGYISDKYGRRIALIISVFNLALFGVIRAFSVNYPMYLAMHLIQTTLGAGTFSTAYIFATEFVGPRFRVLASATVLALFATGNVILGCVAWLLPYWRHMTAAVWAPGFLIVVYYWLLQESVRWLLAKSKFDEAKQVLEKVARMNKKEISEKSLNTLMNPPLPPIAEVAADRPSLIVAIVRSPVLLRRVLTTPIWWITTILVYYGLSINATSLSDTIYLNYILTCAIEIPGFYTAVLTMDRFGRKPTLSVGFLFSAACNFAFAFIPQDLSTLRMVIYLLGKFGISMVLTCLYLYTTELYPTQHRHSLLGFSSMVGRIGSITAPLTPVLMDYWHGIPSVMFGTMAIISGLLALTQPETLGTIMPDTLEEAEALGKPESMRNKKS